MIKLISKVITKIKGREYLIDSSINFIDLISIVLERIVMIIRGTWNKIFFGKANGVIFVGKNVKIKSRNKIKVKSGMTINDGCFINALSINGITIGENFSLGRNSIIECTGVIRKLGDKLVIGNNVGISAGAFISVRGAVRIGNNTIIGPGVKIISENHNFNDISIPIYLQGESRHGVEIGDDCWIGANVVILDGVSIGKGVVIAAGAIVNKNIENYSIIAGIPAKVIKMRK